MNDEQVIVFADERAELAYLLCDRLVEAGIEAVVVNDETRIAVGSIPPGWTTAARVVVAQQDADAAQGIVREFEAEQAALAVPPNEYTSARASATAPSDDSNLEAARCPDCGRPRTAVCPVCQTSSAEFPRADAAPRGLALEEDRAAASDEPMLVCTTCDEPFTPGYLRRCEWCGHDFGEGIQLEAPSPREPLDQRTVATVIALAACLLAILAYFASLVTR